MNTRTTIKSEQDEKTGVGFQLFDDWLYECEGVDAVGLRLDGVPFEAIASGNGRLSVELKLPRKMAEALGLVPALSEAPVSIPDGGEHG